jgi:hypothetical protein
MGMLHGYSIDELGNKPDMLKFMVPVRLVCLKVLGILKLTPNPHLASYLQRIAIAKDPPFVAFRKCKMQIANALPLCLLDQNLQDKS